MTPTQIRKRLEGLTRYDDGDGYLFGPKERAHGEYVLWSDVAALMDEISGSTLVPEELGVQKIASLKPIRLTECAGKQIATSFEGGGPEVFIAFTDGTFTVISACGNYDSGVWMENDEDSFCRFDFQNTYLEDAFCPSIIEHWEKQDAEDQAAKEMQNREHERLEYERLKAKFEGK